MFSSQHVRIPNSNVMTCHAYLKVNIVTGTQTVRTSRTSRDVLRQLSVSLVTFESCAAMSNFGAFVTHVDDVLIICPRIHAI